MNKDDIAEHTLGVDHTPTPWDTDEPHIVYSRDGDRIVYLADTSDLDTDYATAKANAAFIVHCVNAHDELVAALTKCSEVLEDMYRYGVVDTPPLDEKPILGGAYYLGAGIMLMIQSALEKAK